MTFTKINSKSNRRVAKQLSPCLHPYWKYIKSMKSGVCMSCGELVCCNVYTLHLSEIVNGRHIAIFKFADKTIFTIPREVFNEVDVLNIIEEYLDAHDFERNHLILKK